MEWKQIKFKEPDGHNKWELRYEDTLIATINHKVSGKYSLFVYTPRVLAKIIADAVVTHQYDTFEQAQAACDERIVTDVVPWMEACRSYLTAKKLV